MHTFQAHKTGLPRPRFGLYPQTFRLIRDQLAIIAERVSFKRPLPDVNFDGSVAAAKVLTHAANSANPVPILKP
jgi:hypothetical protein